jgi:hypothetical protein
MSIREAAQDAAARGFAVFPVDGKRPLLAWRTESSTDPEAVTSMGWEAATGIGVDCGKSGLVVVDIDDLDAVPELATQLGWDATADETLISRTGRGGMHLFYRAGSTEVKNSASRVVQGIDIRGSGGFVVIPPSSHESGRPYEWLNAFDPAPIPERMVELFNYREERVVEQGTVVLHEKWGFAALAAYAHDIENSPPGTRNESLNRCAFLAFGIVKGGHLLYEVAEARLRHAGLHVGLSSSEVEKTLSSAWESAVPRHPEEQEPAWNPSPVTVESGARPRFRTLTADELEKLPPPQWLLENRLPEGQTWMYGEPGSGKTFLALDWALSVAASGLTVLYFVGEGVTGFAQRVSSWRGTRTRDTSGFLAIPQAPHLLNREAIETLRNTVSDHGPALIVVDTFARAAVGGDENSARDVGMAIDALDGLWRDHNCSSLVLHHSNKSGSGERGSSAIRGAADATWEIIPASPGSEFGRGGQAFCRKMKDAEPPSPVLFQLRSSGESAVVHPTEYRR